MLQKDFDEILESEIISLTGGLTAGFLLTFATDKLHLIPALLILIPGFLEMRGNISASISARITSGLYVGVLKYGHKQRAIIKGNVLASIILVLVLSLFLGMLAYFVTGQFFGVWDTNIILISFVAGLFCTVIEIPITVATTFWIFKRGQDPNNVMGPYITVIGDLVSVTSLLIAITVIV